MITPHWLSEIGVNGSHVYNSPKKALEHARQLERELTEARAALKVWTEQSLSWQDKAKQTWYKLVEAQDRISLMERDRCDFAELSHTRHERDIAEAQLATAQKCPEGWVCVPKAPTEEMLHAVEFWRDTDRCRNEAVRYYIAMLKAAPQPKEAQDD